VAAYRPTYALVTYRVFPRHEMARGDPGPAHFDASMDSLRAAARKRLEQRAAVVGVSVGHSGRRRNHFRGDLAGPIG